MVPIIFTYMMIMSIDFVNAIIGQEIMAPLLQFYMDANGLDILVFSMVDMTRGEEAWRVCISEIERWLNSVISHTYDIKTRKMASVVFVGTHMDVVSSSRDISGINALCETVSNRLYDAFANSPAWPFVLPNEHGKNSAGARTQLNFFGVDNTKGRDDPGIRLLMDLIEREV